MPAPHPHSPRRRLLASVATLTCAGAVAVPASAAPTTPVASAAPAAQPDRPAQPAYGGVLNVLGSGDTDYLDPNISYYSIGYAIAREFSRQLYTYPAVKGATTVSVPDLATGPPRRRDHGRTVAITIRKGARWDTSPARQVKAADVVRGIKITCNPAQPSGALTDYESLIVGLEKFCNGFLQVQPTARAIHRYVARHQVAGLVAHHRTLTLHLTHRAGYLRDLLTLPAFSPRPVEELAYVPASTQLAQHTISDGPYRVASYRPTESLRFVRNPAWQRSSDPIRHAYAARIHLTFTDDPATAVSRIRSGSPSADAYLGAIGTADVTRLRKAGDRRLVLATETALNPFLVFNTVSPNSHGALRHTLVRRALSYALGRKRLRRHLDGGTSLNPALTHLLPPGFDGSRPFNRYPHDRARAVALLKQAGHRHPTLRMLYRGGSTNQAGIFHAVRHQLAAVGVTVKGHEVSPADFYTKYLLNPHETKTGGWDIVAAGWGPDWYGDGALSIFKPLLDGRTSPPFNEDFGFFNDPAVNRLIDRAQRAIGSRAADLWHRADVTAMNDAPIYPITNPTLGYLHARQVHHFVAVPELQGADLTNVWLSPSDNGA